MVVLYVPNRDHLRVKPIPYLDDGTGQDFGFYRGVFQNVPFLFRDTVRTLETQLELMRLSAIAVSASSAH